MNGNLTRFGGVRGHARVAEQFRKCPARNFGIALCAVIAAGFVPHADASTPAGTLISNTAHVRYELDGVVHQLDTNAVVTRVDELVAFEVEDAPSSSTNTPNGESILAFIVRNIGNGCEAVAFDAKADPNVGMSVASIAVDTNDSGAFEQQTDATYTPASAPRLCPGQSTRIFVIMQQSALNAADDGEVTLVAHGASGTSTYGDVIDNASDTGGDVVVGSGAPHRRWFAFKTTDAVRVSLLKSQLVLADPLAGSVREGDVVSYTLRLRADGAGLVENAVLSDPLPAGVAYLPGSLSIDGERLSDGADGDYGDVVGSLVTVRLPAAQAPFDHVVTFNARVGAPL